MRLPVAVLLNVKRVLAARHRAPEVIPGAERHTVADAAAELVDRGAELLAARQAGGDQERLLDVAFDAEVMGDPSVNDPNGNHTRLATTAGPAPSE